MTPIALGCILGHHPLLSIAELLAFSGNTADITAYDREFVLFENNYDDILRYPDSLGGIQKVCLIVKKTTRNDIIPSLSQLMSSLIYKKGITKLTFAVSAYGLDKDFQRAAIVSLKRYAASLVPSKVRFINKDLSQNPATAALLGQKVIEKGLELVVFNQGTDYYIGYTTWVQDIASYTKRDIDKPKRNMKVGMLPPKLAQTLINLIPGGRGVEVIWDPFVGLGTIPMEALLLGRHVISSDHNERMVSATEGNISWIKKIYRLPEELLSEAFVKDVAKLDTLPNLLSMGRSAIVTEGYLGENYTATARKEDALEQLKEVAELYGTFFQNLNNLGYTEPVVITFPFHITAKGEFVRYEELKNIVEKAGFVYEPLLRPEYVHLFDTDKKMKELLTKEGSILYTRGQQFVGREIMCVRKK